MMVEQLRFAGFEVRDRARRCARPGEEIIVDNFAGGGGASMGIELSLGRAVDVAINHDADAIVMHEINHPETKHIIDDVFNVDPFEVTQGRPVGLAWFSPDCKHFSKAKGGKPVEKRIRDLAWVVVKWARAVAPRIIILENVEEFKTWGPLRKNSKPCGKRRGKTFRRWVTKLVKCGYRVEWRELRACDYGAPTIRKRLFVIARRDGEPIVWPAPTHGPGLRSYRTAGECIDWSLPCDGRVRSATIARRIATEGERYAGRPWIMAYYGNGGTSSVDEPLRTVTTRDRFALVMPDGRFRMLTPRELARAQGFPSSYVLRGTREHQVAKIGNSVCPPIAAALVRANVVLRDNKGALGGCTEVAG